MPDKIDPIKNLDNGQPVDEVAGIGQKELPVKTAAKKPATFSNKGAAITNRFDPRQVELTEVKDSSEQAPDHLGHKEVLKQLEFFGNIYRKEEIKENLEKIILQIVEEYRNGRKLEAVQAFKRLPPELQAQALNLILDNLDTKRDGFVENVKGMLADADIMNLYKDILQQNSISINFTKEDKAGFEEKLAAKGLPVWAYKMANGFTGLLELGEAIGQKITELKNSLTDDTQKIADLSAKLIKKKEIPTEELLGFQKKIADIRLVLKEARLSILTLKKMGRDEEASALEKIVLTMEAEVSKFLTAAKEYLQNCPEEKKAVIQQIISEVQNK